MKYFSLKRVTEDGVIDVSPGQPYWEDGFLNLTLKEMALGVSKYAIFRLYNEMDHDTYQIIDTLHIRFDISEAFTKYKEYRYDAPYDTSLRKFIKITFSPGSINSDFIGSESYEISSVYHAYRDYPIVGIFLTRNPEIYARLVSNPEITKQNIVLPLFPAPGEYFSFKIGVMIPSKLEEDFLGKAGGFPVKQADFKSPYTTFDTIGALRDLQFARTATNNAQRKYLQYFGLLDQVYGSDTSTEYTADFNVALLSRTSLRSYIVKNSPMNPTSLVPASPVFSLLPGTYFANSPIPAFRPNYFYDGLPAQVKVDKSTNNIDIPPSLEVRKVNEFLKTMLLMVAEYITYLHFDNPLPEPDYLDLAAKIQSVVNHHLQNLLSAYSSMLPILTNGYSHYNASTNLEEYESSVAYVLAVIMSNLFKALSVLVPATVSITPRVYVPSSCIGSVFLNEPSSTYCADVERDLGRKNVKGIPLRYVLDAYSQDNLEVLMLIHYIVTAVSYNHLISSSRKALFDSIFDYGKTLLNAFTKYINASIANKLFTLDEREPTGSTNEMMPGYSTDDLFHIWLLYEITDQILGLEDTGARQAWHYINKFAEHKGVYTDIPIKILVRNKTVENIADNVDEVLENLDVRILASQALLSYSSLKQAEKLFTIKLAVTPIM